MSVEALVSDEQVEKFLARAEDRALRIADILGGLAVTTQNYQDALDEVACWNELKYRRRAVSVTIPPSATSVTRELDARYGEREG